MSSADESVASFGIANDAYRYARPTYPADLFDWIAKEAPSTERALDCATGSGQAAQSLAERFGAVDAFDLHQSQIDAATQAPNITYRQSSAEETPYADNSFDAITAAQSVHWFDHPRYWAEMQRIAKPGAIYCAMGYNRFLGAEEIDELLINPLLDLIDHLWAPNNKLVWYGYDPAALQFPLEPIDMDIYPMRLRWSLDRYIQFMESWSAMRKARQNAEMAATIDDMINGLLARIDGETELDLVTNTFAMAGRF